MITKRSKVGIQLDPSYPLGSLLISLRLILIITMSNVIFTSYNKKLHFSKANLFATTDYIDKLVASSSRRSSSRICLIALRFQLFIAFAERKNKVPFSMAIGSEELMHECFPKHSRMGTARMK